MIRSLIRDQIVLTDVYISRAAERIANQRLRACRTSGNDKQDAEILLDRYVKFYEQMEDHREKLENYLKLVHSSISPA